MAKITTENILKVVRVLAFSGVGIELVRSIRKHRTTPPEEYSDEWFDSLSDDELDAEREKTRLKFCSSGDDPSGAAYYQKMLYIFDKEIRKRYDDKHKGEEYIYPPHREHGWNLYKDDD